MLRPLAELVPTLKIPGDGTVQDAGTALRVADRAMYQVKGHRGGHGVTRRVTAHGERLGAPGGMPVLRLVGPDSAQ